MKILARLLANGIAILIASQVIPGVRIDTLTAGLIAGVFLGIVNMLVRPVLLLFTLPLTLLTLGLFIFVVNSACLALVAYLVPGFTLDGFWSAFFGALLVSVVSWVINGVLVPRETRR